MVDTASKKSKEGFVAKTDNSVTVTTYGRKRKAEDTKIVVNDQLVQEDEFTTFYNKSAAGNAGLVVQPPFNLKTLAHLVTKNNTLAQCIATMEVNIDGTGFMIESTDPNAKNGSGSEKSADELALEAFFNTPYPEVSFMTQRRQVRWDVEAIGNGYLEIIRNLEKKIVFLRYVDAKLIRLVRLDDAVPVEKELVRGNETFKATVMVRERRYATIVGTKLQYYKEFNASREINRATGEWVTENSTSVTPAMYGSELIHFTAEQDVRTAYGIPRWINQLPSVIGSRKSEEFNLDFFDNGGVPPAAIFIQGGTLGNDVKKQLDGYFGGGAKGKQRVAIVEVQSSSGSLDSAGSVQVKTERFGDVKASDSMFQNYDKNCEDHVRMGFRLPPIFLGKSADYNFATAMTAYMVTEMQVFEPERKEFDEIINTKIVASFGYANLWFRSNPMTLKNIDVQLKGLDMVKDKIKPEQIVETVNTLTGLALEYDSTTDTMNMQLKQSQLDAANAATAAVGAVNPPPVSGAGTKNNVVALVPKPAAVKKAGELVNMNWLVKDWMTATGMSGGDLAGQRQSEIIDKVDSLTDDSRVLFNSILALKMFEVDESSLSELAGCCADAISGTTHAH